MSFDRNDPDHCPTCDTTEPCVHRATRTAHVAYREGRDAFDIPWSNGETPPPWKEASMYPEGSDDECWFVRGYTAAANRAALVAQRFGVGR